MNSFYTTLQGLDTERVNQVLKAKPEYVQHIISHDYRSQTRMEHINHLPELPGFLDRLSGVATDPLQNPEKFAWNLFELGRALPGLNPLSSWLIEEIEKLESSIFDSLTPGIICRLRALKACALDNLYRANPFKYAQRAHAACLAADQIDLKNEDLNLWIKLKIAEASTLMWQPGAEHSSNLDKSIALNLEMLDLLKDSSNLSLVRLVQTNLAASYSRRPSGSHSDNLEKTIHHYNVALDLADQENNPEAIATIRNNLGLNYRRRIVGDQAENIEKSIEYLNDALTHHIQTRHELRIAQTLTNLGVSYCERRLGDRADNLHKAITCYRKALKLMDPVAHEGFCSWVLHNTGVAYYFLSLDGVGQYIEKTIDCYTRALVYRQRDKTPLEWLITTRNLCIAYVARKKGSHQENCRKALALLQGAMDAIPRKTHRVEWARTNVTQGILLSHLSHDDNNQSLLKAVNHFYNALEVLKPDVLPSETRSAAIHLGQVLIRLQRYDEACDALQMAVAADTHLYEQMFISQARTREIDAGSNAYYLMAHACAQKNEMLAALKWLEKGKSRILKEKLSLDRAQFRELPDELKDDYIRTTQRLQALNIEHYIPGREIKDIIKDTETTRNSLKMIIKKAQQILPDFMDHSVVVEDQLALLDPERMILQFNFTELGTDVFMIQRKNQKTHIECIANPLFTVSDMQQFNNTWLRRLHRLSVTTNRDDQMRWGTYALRKMNTLSRQLMDPLSATIAGSTVSKITLIPQMSMHLLPLNLLSIKDGNRRVPLINRFPVSILPSLVIAPFEKSSQQLGKVQRYIGICNPTGDLIWSDREINQASAVFDSRNVTILRGGDATPETVLEKIIDADIVHFACHARINLKEPYKSYLALAAGDTTRNSESSTRVIQHRVTTDPLYLADIFRELKLQNHPLVVLSCCDSGLSSISSTADEFVSFGTGFLGSGARAVVSSLWQIDDQAGCQLMTLFYNKIVKGNITSEQALREAQLEMKNNEKYANPFYWAAFVYCGW